LVVAHSHVAYLHPVPGVTCRTIGDDVGAVRRNREGFAYGYDDGNVERRAFCDNAFHASLNVQRPAGFPTAGAV
jgi:hypothetical protein